MAPPRICSKSWRTSPPPDPHAIRLPGRSGEAVSYLPLDARFPHEAYDRLIDAIEVGDAQAAEQSGAELEHKLLRAAERIHTQFIDPPTYAAALHAATMADGSAPSRGLNIRWATIAPRPVPTHPTENKSTTRV